MIPDTPKNDYRSIRLTFESAEQFNTLALNWDVDWRQLQKGAFKGDLFLLKDHEAQIYQFSMNRRLEFSGSGPSTKDGITFGFSRQGVYSGSWCNREIFDDSLLVWGGGDETFESITPPLLNVNVFTLSEELLTEAAQALDYPTPLNGIVGKRLVYTAQGRRIRQLRVLFEQILHNIEARNSTLFWNDAKFTIACQIISILTNSYPSNTQAKSPRYKYSALTCALKHIEANVDEPVTVRDLCRITGASERTLQYAFQERFHVPPKAYLKAVRLNGARKQLLHADPQTTRVTDVANAWGFWHMGQFAADYKAFFSEKPSETLHCQP